jgi:CRP-like cAMP-binding protein
MAEDAGNRVHPGGRAVRGPSPGAVSSGVGHRDENGNNCNNAATPGERPPLFAGILPAEYMRIAAAGRVRDYARGEMLYNEGEPVQQVLLLTAGAAKINKVGMSGMEVILGLGISGDVLGATGLFSSGMHCTSAQAFRSCRALVWEAPAFKALVERFPVLHQNLFRILGNYVVELEERFREVATEKVGARVASQLVRLWEKIGRPVNGQVEVGLSREELAQMTGTNLFTVSRLLSSWAARGMVRPRRETVTICDVQSLRALSEEGPLRAMAAPADDPMI